MNWSQFERIMLCCHSPPTYNTQAIGILSLRNLNASELQTCPDKNSNWVIIYNFAEWKCCNFQLLFANFSLSTKVRQNPVFFLPTVSKSFTRKLNDYFSNWRPFWISCSLLLLLTGKVHESGFEMSSLLFRRWRWMFHLIGWRKGYLCLPLWSTLQLLNEPIKTVMVFAITIFPFYSSHISIQ